MIPNEIRRPRRIDLLNALAISVVLERVDDPRRQRRLRHPVLEVPSICRKLIRRRRGDQEIAVGVPRIRRRSIRRLARNQFVRGVVRIRRRHSPRDLREAITDRVVRIRDIITVRSAPLLVRQLIRFVVRPSHAIARSLDDALTISHGIIRVIERRQRRRAGTDVRDRKLMVRRIIRIRSSRSIRQNGRGSSARGIVQERRDLILRIDELADSSRWIVRVRESAPLGLGERLPLTDRIISVRKAHSVGTRLSRKPRIGVVRVRCDSRRVVER